MAEGLIRNALTAAKKGDCHVDSAGLGALVGHPPDPIACQLMLDNGIDISGYRARQVNKEMIRKADLILVMESAHKSLLKKANPVQKEKFFVLVNGENSISLILINKTYLHF